MQITLSDAQVRLLRDFVERINLAHMLADCEPPGYAIEIGFGGPLGCDAVAKCGPQSLELGEVSVFPEQNNWIPAVTEPNRE